ncbi:ATP/GTP-binding protein [Actinomadura meridiana]|uniref:ATP/GTP-binding protein n=1 Tax=Actinomadura meridiana TaxID=559626 RepID=A0ABP8CQX6_9ACTN
MTTTRDRGVAPHLAVKIIVAGGFGAGKTTLIGSVSESPPLLTEEILTENGARVDSLDGVAAKTTTTVALDHGRRTLKVPRQLTLLLFGTPGQDRFRVLWDELTYGAVGAVVVADTRRLTDSFDPIDYFENRKMPFVVAVNEFDGAHRYPVPAVRRALALPPPVPVVPCDARDFASAVTVLKALVTYALTARTRMDPTTGPPAAPGPDPRPPQGAHP